MSASGSLWMASAGEHLRLGADFEAVVERPAGVEDLFDDFAKLVDLDREDAAVVAAVVVLGDGAVERVVQRLDAVPQQILKTDEQRRVEVQRLRLAKRVDDRYGDAAFLQRRNGQVAVRIYVRSSRCPTGRSCTATTSRRPSTAAVRRTVFGFVPFGGGRKKEGAARGFGCFFFFFSSTPGWVVARTSGAP